jgi:hypothetical protein
LALVVAVSACNKSKSDHPESPGFGGGPSRERGPIHDIMLKIGGKGQSMTQTIGNELNESPTPWEKIQPQTKEYAQLIASLSKYDPPRGSKESWAKRTASFSESAAALDRAANAKDIDSALAAHQTVSQSCMACHREHKGGPGGFRGPGGPPRPAQ